MGDGRRRGLGPHIENPLLCNEFTAHCEYAEKGRGVCPFGKFGEADLLLKQLHFTQYLLRRVSAPPADKSIVQLLSTSKVYFVQ